MIICRRRRGYGFLILSLTGLCGAVALPPKQDEPKAEAVFRNITSFKGNKASDVIPAMQFMSASLKVGCDFCHVADRSSDEKGEKKTAREMVEMQRDINAKNFGGRTQVTCATCHAGHPHPINFSPAEGNETRTRRSPAVKPEEVLAAYTKACGVDATHSVTGLRLKGTTGTTVKSAVETTYLAGKFAVVTKAAPSDSKQGFNGASAWFTRGKEVQKMPLQYATEFINQRAIYLGPDSLPKLANPSGGTANIAGKDELVVTGALQDKTRVSLFFDKATSLLTRVAIYYPTVLGSIAQINDYSDYKKVNGIEVPMTIESHSSQGDDVYHFRSAKFDDKIDVTVFDPPAKN